MTGQILINGEAIPPSEHKEAVRERVIRAAGMFDFRYLHVRPNELKYSCPICRQKFTDENVKTDAGWRETQISGLCEVCFDKAFSEEV